MPYNSARKTGDRGIRTGRKIAVTRLTCCLEVERRMNNKDVDKMEEEL